MERAIPDVFDDLEIGITVHDPETGEILGVNERLEELYGYTARELREMDVEAYSTDEGGLTQDEVERRIRAAAEGEPGTFEWQVERGDGTNVWVGVRLARTTLDGKTVVVAEVRDVTERKERERELERKTRAIEAAPIGITISDPDQDDNPLVYVNDYFEEMTGYPAAEALGRNCRFLQGEETSAEAVSQLREGIEAAEPVSVDLRNYRQDGELFWNRVSIAPVRDTDGTVTNFVGFQQDVTEEKERQQELAAERSFIQQSLDSLDDVFYMLGTGGTLQRWNDAVSEVTGYSDEEIGEMNAMDFFEGEDRKRVGDSIEQTLEEGSAVVEADYVTKDGRRIPYEFTGTRLTDADGRLRGIIGIGRDITGRKEYETKLERSNERLQQFASVLSHDLQEPLRMVSSYIELLETELGDELDDETREYMEFAVDGAERMQEMIDSLLQYSRVETHGGDFEETDVGAVLEDVRHDLKYKLEDANVEVVAGDLPTVEADPQQVGQLLRNLVKNSIDHGTTGHDRVTTVEITAEETPDGWELAVADDGPGIPAEQQNDVFGLFEKGADSDGTGVGLAVCERIVDRHDGTIRFESTPGDGTTFYVTFPKV